MQPFLYIFGTSISFAVLVIALRSYRRKTGVHIRGSFGIASSRSGPDKYVSEVVLENLKDRGITVFAIYLQIGYAYHIEIESFENSPIILKPYESYSRQYGPLEFYAVGHKRVDFNPLLDSRRIRKRLVLSTSVGRYVVKSALRRWNPIGEFFRNHFAAVARPVHAKYKDRFIGGNIKYVIEFTSSSGVEEVVPIHPEDYRLKIFKNFQLTEEALESKESLERFLTAQQKGGAVNFQKAKVHDMDEWRERAHAFFDPNPVVAERHGVFQYYVIGRAYTIYSNWKLKQKNKTIQRKRAKNREDA